MTTATSSQLVPSLVPLLLLARPACAAAEATSLPPAGVWTWTVAQNWNAVPSGQRPSTSPDLASCEAQASYLHTRQFAYNKHSQHCFTSNDTAFGGAPSDHVTSGCRVGWVAGCTATPPRPAPPPPRTKAFPPGWNGLARRPPMGWRSWNALGATTDQHDMVDMVALMASKTAFGQGGVKGQGQGGDSLLDLGYSSVGIDEGWEGCGSGVNGTQHDASGTPVIHTPSFPDMKGLVELAHRTNLTIGWYQNGCACGELQEKVGPSASPALPTAHSPAHAKPSAASTGTAPPSLHSPAHAKPSSGSNA